jgi:phage tail-like protein
VVVGRRELGFAEVGPLTSETILDEHGYAPLTLRRAISQDTALYDWRRKRDKRTVTIEQLDRAGGSVVNAWRLENAWPRKWSGPAFNAASNEVAMEELELTYDNLVWLTPSEGDRRGRTA